VKAVCWHGKFDVRVEEVSQPKILNPHDAVLRVRVAGICGSDLHLYDAVVPGMESGEILGHEFLGEVIEIGSEVQNLQVGDRVVVPSIIACGSCFLCQRGLWAFCDNSNPNAAIVEKSFGYCEAGMFGYSRVHGGYPGGQAEYVRVPFADVGPLKVPNSVSDEQALLLSDTLPTAFMAAENRQIRSGDIVAVWGCGPVGQLAIKCAYLFGAERVIAIDGQPARLEMAEKQGKAIPLASAQDLLEPLKALTGGRGPDACIDAVGLEAHRRRHETRYDQSKKAWDYSPKVPHILQQAIQVCRKGGSISVPGFYAREVNDFPLGAAYAKGLTLRMGPTHVHSYMRPLLKKIQSGEIDPTFIITHRLALDDARNGYAIFNERLNGCIKVVLRP
jgi:threonine dehydrogenase-like Zn-dependent dehydrogenase